MILLSLMNAEAIQNSTAAPKIRNIVSVSGDTQSPIRYFDIGMNIPNIVFVPSMQMCPFILSDVIFFRLKPPYILPCPLRFQHKFTAISAMFYI